MSSFSPAWLQLREVADHRSRSTFADQLAAGEHRRWSVIDLGAGTGSNHRFMAPVLSGSQGWICIDNDSTLLAVLERSIAASEFVSVSAQLADIAADPHTLLANAATRLSSDAQFLITASALLDLVSSDWIDAITHTCNMLQASALFALTYDGRIELSPQHNDDARLIAAVNAHQLSDKGFGPALGPAAAGYAATAFKNANFETHSQRSDWLLDAADTELLSDLVAGWLEAAREVSENNNEFGEWFACRSAQISAGKLSVCVGHSDLLAIPNGA